MEEQILRYYLKAFSFIFIIIIFILLFHVVYIFNKNIEIKQNPISINKGDNIEEVLKNNIYDVSILEITLVKIYLQLPLIYIQITTNLSLTKFL